MKNKPAPALLAFADGTVFVGESAGYPTLAVGEAVFNTAICGYQEIISDPSYHRQIINFTHPHIGNTGATPKDDESSRPGAAGIIVRRLTAVPSSWRAVRPLDDYLREHKIPAITDIDTRAITRKLRDNGAMAVCLDAENAADSPQRRRSAVAAAAAFTGLSGAMLADKVSGKHSATWEHGLWQAGDDNYPRHTGARHVAVLDCGVKTAILRHLAARGCRVTVLPYHSDITAVRALKPDGVLFSNGPGDPAPCAAAEQLARDLLGQKTPLFGICLGHQIIAAALGAKTIKMKFGHHGANHPVCDVQSGRVLITSQNHGFAVAADSLPDGIRATHTSLFDGSLQGLASDNPPAMTFQGHPEASPGPQDAAVLFDRFVKLMDERK